MTIGDWYENRRRNMKVVAKKNVFSWFSVSVLYPYLMRTHSRSQNVKCAIFARGTDI